MLHRFLLLWQPLQFLQISVFTLLVLGVGEMIAENVSVAHLLPGPATTSGQSDAGSEVGGVSLALRSLALPNYWVWYEPDAVYAAIEAQHKHLHAFLGSLIFNAAFATAVVGMWHTVGLMCLVVRAYPRDSWLQWQWVVPVAAFVADLAEDLALLIVTLGYPLYRREGLVLACSWFSFLKFVGWLATYFLAACAFLSLQMSGPARKEKTDEGDADATRR